MRVTRFRRYCQTKLSYLSWLRYVGGLREVAVGWVGWRGFRSTFAGLDHPVATLCLAAGRVRFIEGRYASRRKRHRDQQTASSELRKESTPDSAPSEISADPEVTDAPPF
jgi:hypothetical protein